MLLVYILLDSLGLFFACVMGGKFSLGWYMSLRLWWLFPWGNPLYFCGCKLLGKHNQRQFGNWQITLREIGHANTTSGPHGFYGLWFWVEIIGSCSFEMSGWTFLKLQRWFLRISGQIGSWLIFKFLATVKLWWAAVGGLSWIWFLLLVLWISFKRGALTKVLGTNSCLG